MNAIQYFDWGDNGKEIPFCKVRVKDYFTTQKGKNIERYMPIKGDYKSKITFGVINPSGINSVDTFSKSFEVIREGNDIVCKTYIRSDFRETRKITGVDFHINFNSVREYIPSNSQGNLYINGRKVKLGFAVSSIDVHNIGISFYMAGGGLEKGMIYEDNGESVTFQSLFGKELTIVLS